MWQLFTERARRVILLAQEEAGQMNSGHVGTEHLLLGLLRENESVGAQVLQQLGIPLPSVRAEIERELEPSTSPNEQAKLTPGAKRVLELAAEESRLMQHNYIGTEHLLLALLREKDGLAATVLRRLGLNLDRARTQVMEYLGPNASLQPEAQAVEKVLDETPAAASAEAQIMRDLKHFVDNLNHGMAFPHNSRWIFGARQGWFGGHVWADNWNQHRLAHQIQLKQLDFIKVEGDEAVVSVSFRVKPMHADESQLPAKVREVQERVWTEELTFRRTADRKDEALWQIVPAEEFPRAVFDISLPLLNQAAFALSQKSYEAMLKNPTTRVIYHLRELSMAAVMLNADWGSLVFAPQFVQPALTPYLEQRESQTENLIPRGEFFTVPDSKDQFCFNSHLSEQSLDELAQPEQTVLFYDGAGENLIFRYDGQAAIACANGHCRLISPDEAKTLIWKP